MKHKNVIEINGKLYDARTGAPISSMQPASKPPTSKKQATINHRPVDGFKRHTAKIQTTPKTIHSEPVTNKPAPAATAKRNHTAPSKASLKAKRSLTLNRNAVSAPSLATPTPAKKPPAPHVGVESSALKHVNPTRLARAKTAAKSPVISRFSTGPAATAQQKDIPSTDIVPAASTLTKHLQTSHTPHKTHSTHLKEELIKSAVKHATSASNHTRSSRKKFRFAKFAPIALIALLLGGYVAYLNVPEISMKVAAHRAGFAATMPGYKPSGYSLSGPIIASPGEVSVNFASNTDDRNFKLTQQPTTWDSTALLENLVVKKSANYLTYQDRGLTIYIFDGSNAMWVNGGKLYQVQGNNSQLDTDQLLKLATSV